MRTISKVGLFLFFLFIADSCTDSKVDSIQKTKDHNSLEFKKVIEHYKLTKETEKLKAAIFLIENMTGHSSIKGKFLDEIKNVNLVIDRENNQGAVDFKLLDSIVKTKIDSLKDYYGNSLIRTLFEEKDVDVITSEYLIENIDQSFYMWKKMPWAKHVSFNQFCEFILPYRVYNEPLTSWRKLLSEKVLYYSNYLKDPSDPLELCQLINDSIYQYWKHLDNMPNIFPGITDLDRYLGGTCQHHHLYMTSVFRSVGIPACIDDTPQNNDWKDRHAWIGILAKDGKVYKIDIGNPNCKFVSNVPLGKGGATKVYRKTFSNNKHCFHEELVGDQIPEYFQNRNQKDVTSEYTFKKRDVSFKIDGNVDDEKYMFLCAPDLAFDTRAVAVSKVRYGKVKFRDVGYPALYFCATFGNGNINYHSYPIYIDKTGQKKDIVPSLDVLQDMKLYRKYKPSDSVLVYVNEMIGAKIQGSNSPDFTDAKDLFTFSNPQDYFDEIEIPKDGFFRYYRYVGNPQKRINIAEIEFIGYYSNDTTLKKIIGVPFSNSKSSVPNSLPNNAFDGDIRTNYLGTSGAWVGIDLGNRKASLTGIGYLVRNHFNIVEVNDFYELFYFDGNGWISKGIQKARNNYIEYEDVPSNSIYLLKNHSKGKQERMFMYENGKQFYF